MRTSQKRDDRTRLRHELNENAEEIRRHLATAPDMVDAREALWIKRFELMEQER